MTWQRLGPRATDVLANLRRAAAGTIREVLTAFEADGVSLAHMTVGPVLERRVVNGRLRRSPETVAGAGRDRYADDSAAHADDLDSSVVDDVRPVLGDDGLVERATKRPIFKPNDS